MNLLNYPETDKIERIYKFYSKFPKLIKLSIVLLLYNLNKVLSKRTYFPQTLTFYLTWKCNAKCKHCFVWKNLNKNDKELTLAEIEKIFSSSKGTLSRVAYAGGEPFLRNDIVEISKILYKRARIKKLWSGTNGLQPTRIYETTKKIIQEIKIPFVVTVSIEGLENTHNEIIGVDNAFEKAVKTVNLLKQLTKRYTNFQVRVLITISNKNVNEIEDLTEFVQRKLKVFPLFNFIWGSNISCYFLKGKIQSNVNPPDEEFKLPSLEHLIDINKKINDKVEKQTLLSKIEHVRRKYIIEIIKTKKRSFPCQASLGKNAVIFPNGDVSYCEFTKTIGNLKDFDYSLPLLLNSPNAKNIQSQLKECICNLPYILTSSMVEDFNMLKEILL